MPEDDLRLQATLIIGSLASGGQAFLRPLCAADVPKTLVRTLSTETGPRLAISILQALKALATFWSAAEDLDIEYDLWSALFNMDSLEVFRQILQQPATTIHAKQQLRLVADIVSALPDTAQNSKALITSCCLLDTFASLLVAHAVATKLVVYSGDESSLLTAPPDASIPSILAAVSTIITGSNYRAHRFILSQQVRDLFTNTGQDDSDQRSAFGARHGFANPHEPLLPPLHIPTYRTISHNPVSNHFPALKSLQPARGGSSSSDGSTPVGDIDHSNAVVGWLLVLIRSMSGLNRLIGLRLLALVANAIEVDPVGASFRSEFSQKTRERQKQLSMLAVPLAVSLVQKAHDDKFDGTENQSEGQGIREQACNVLALLIGGSKELQIAAVEAGAVKHVCPILKKSFDNVSFAKPMWSAKSNTPSNVDAPETSRLGVSTFPQEIAHAMRCREGALKAIEAIAAREDVHRKAIIEHGVIGCIIDSMKPFAPNAIGEAASSRITINPKDGNTTSVILAACYAAKSMSRSVSILRTSLIDGGIAKPLVQLLHHSSLDVQIAATDVCCNLLPEFSPMKDDLLENNVIKTLVEHCRSSSPALRLSSLWALKHLVYGAPKEIKMNTLEELGTGWLVDIIQGEHREGAQGATGGVSVGLSTPNAAGEQVDLLNPSSMDVDEPVAEEPMEEDDEDGEVLYDEASSTHYQSSSLRSTLNPPASTFNSRRYLSSIREMEQNEEYASRKDEAAIQAQALDFLRNLMNGDDAAALSDHLMSAIGTAKVYELLTAKLSPIPRSISTGKPVYSPTELVLSTIHVIIHLANASPKHRQMLIAQRSLLQALLPHFNHLDHRVRVMSVWAVNSLTWIEEDADRRDARQRATELRSLGIEQAVRALQGDPNLDVRERVKTAMRQFETL